MTRKLLARPTDVKLQHIYCRASASAAILLLERAAVKRQEKLTLFRH